MAAVLPTSPAGNEVTCVCVLPVVGVTVAFVIKLDITDCNLVSAATDFGLSLTKLATAEAGCITVLRSSSPTTAVYAGSTIGRISL